MLYFPVLLLFFVYIANAQNTVSVSVPVANQPITPGKNVRIQYTILATTLNNNNINSTPKSYPSSMDLVFRWQAIDNRQKPLEFNARKNLRTDAFPGGIKDQAYQQYWKAPSQKFFDRYKPTEWKFFLVFQPNYPKPPIFNTNLINNQIPQQQQQQNNEIIIPLDIQPSNIVKQSGHHKKETKAL